MHFSECAHKISGLHPNSRQLEQVATTHAKDADALNKGYNSTTALEGVWELRKVESRANFMIAKLQRRDQIVEAIDRLSMGRNRSGDPIRLSFS